MTPSDLKTAIEEALKAQFNAGVAVTRLSMVFDAVHPAKDEEVTKPENADANE
jgi:hypothetical protein